MVLSGREKDAVFLLSAPRMFEHVQGLCNFGPRHLGSSGERQTHRYLDSHLASMGAVVRRIPFEIAIARSAEGRLEILSPAHHEIEIAVNYRSAPTPGDGIITERVVDIGLGVEKDYEGKDVVGAVVLATEGSMHAVPKAELAAAKGVAACIWANSREGNLISTYGLSRFGSPIPVVSITRESGELLRTLLRRGDMRIALQVRTDLSIDTGHHVVGILEGERWPDERVILCAHYETVPNTVGADDNASGVAIALEVMRALGKIGMNRTVWAVFSSGEEGGAPGMRAYVKEKEDEVRKTKAFFDLDTLGYGTRLCRVTSGLWPHRTVSTSPRLNELLKQSANDLGYELLDDVSQLGLADAEPFADAEVPTAWLRTRGNTYLHTRLDSPDRVEPNALKIPAEILLVTLLRLDQQAPV